MLYSSSIEDVSYLWYIRFQRYLSSCKDPSYLKSVIIKKSQKVWFFLKEKNKVHRAEKDLDKN